MNIRLIILGCAIAALLGSCSAMKCSPGVASPAALGEDRTKWLAQCIEKIKTIKVGSSRGDLLKLFEQSGGLFDRTRCRYNYREGAYIQVDVEFEPVGHPDDKIIGYPEDKITKISKPYLDYLIED